MIDRTIKLVSVLLGGLVVFLAGYLLATVGQDQPAGEALKTSPAAEAQPERRDPLQSDMPTKRVKTIPIRPDELTGTP